MSNNEKALRAAFKAGAFYGLSLAKREISAPDEDQYIAKLRAEPLTARFASPIYSMTEEELAEKYPRTQEGLKP